MSSRMKVLVAVVALIALVAGVLLWTRNGAEETKPVQPSTLKDYAARGSLVDDEALVEAAAHAWRDTASAEQPGRGIELLWAGEVPADDIDETTLTSTKRLDVVVLESDRLIAAVALQRSGDSVDSDVLGTTKRSNFGQRMLDLPAGLVLVADDWPETRPISMAQRDGTVSEVLARDGLLATGEESAALRLPQPLDDTEPADIFVSGASFAFRSKNDEGRTWDMLTDGTHSAAIRELTFAAAHERGRPIDMPEVTDLWLFDSPEGLKVLVLAIDGRLRSGWTSVQAVTVRQHPNDDLVLMDLGRQDHAGPWVAGAWMEPQSATPYYLAVGDRVSSMTLAVGKQRATFEASGGILKLHPPKAAGEEPPQALLSGTDADGNVVIALKTDN